MKRTWWQSVVAKCRLSYIENLLTYIAMVSIMFMMLVTTTDVAGRYLVNQPLFGAIEFQENLIVVVVLLGLAYSQRQGLQVGVDLVYEHLKGRLQHGLRFFWLIIVLLLFGAVTVSGLKFFLQDLATGAYTGNILHWPRAPFSFTVPLGSLLLCLRTIAQLKQEGESIVSGGK